MRPLSLVPPDELDPLRARYVPLLIHAATTGEPPARSPMDAALALCDVLAGRERRFVAEPLMTAAVVDGDRHRHVFHPALLAYAVAISARLKTPNDAIDVAALVELIDRVDDAVEDELKHNAHDVAAGDVMAAVDAPRWCRAAWTWLARWIAAPLTGEADPPSPSVFVPFQRKDGSFFAVENGENAEAHWHHELVLLHALTSYALVSGDGRATDSAQRAACYHHRETQPDHATGQPWAVHAFLLDAETTPTADLMLLAAGVHQPSGPDAVSRVLLADAAVCLLAGGG